MLWLQVPWARSVIRAVERACLAQVSLHGVSTRRGDARAAAGARDSQRSSHMPQWRSSHACRAVHSFAL